MITRELVAEAVRRVATKSVADSLIWAWRVKLPFEFDRVINVTHNALAALPK